MKFLVINSDTKHVLEEHDLKHLADKARAKANIREEIPIYFVQPTCPVCDSEEMTKVDFDSNQWQCDNCRNIVEIK